MMVREFIKEHGEIDDQTTTELTELAKDYLAGKELLPENASETASAFVQATEYMRSAKLREYLRQVSEMPMTEELGTTMVTDRGPEPVTMARLGIDPEGLTGDTQVDEKTASMLVLTDIYNQMSLRATMDKEYYRVFMSQKAMLGYLLEQRGDMTIGQLQNWLFGPRTTDSDGKSVRRGGVINLSMTKGLFAGIDTEKLAQILDSLGAEETLTADTVRDRLADQYPENKTPERTAEYWATITGTDDQLIPLAAQYRDRIQFATNLKGGAYSSLVKDWLTNDRNPARVKERGAVDTWYAMGPGNHSFIHEDTRSPALFGFRGMPNPLDIFGVTPMKMNEAYGAWMVKLLGKRTAGLLGFHSALGADPIGKGIPGALGSMIKGTAWGRELDKKLKIGAKPGADMARIQAVRIIDSVTQHSYSIMGELAGAGFDRESSLLLVEAIGGIKQKNQQFDPATRSLDEPDIHRYNRVFANSRTVPLTAADRAWLEDDSIAWTDPTGASVVHSIDDLRAIGHENYLRKGQMSVKLLTEMLRMVPDANFELLSEKGGSAGLNTFDRNELRAEFSRIAEHMMYLDHNALTTSLTQRAADPNPLSVPIRHFTIDDIISRVNRVESRLEKVGSTVPAEMGRIDWPHVWVNLGKDENGNDIVYEAEMLKEFVSFFYKAKARKVAELGVYGVQQVNYNNALENTPVLAKLGLPVTADRMPADMFSLVKDSMEDKTDPVTGAVIGKKKNWEVLGLSEEDLRRLRSDGYVMFEVDDNAGGKRMVRIDLPDKRSGSLEGVYFTEYDQYAKIEKKTDQGFVTTYDPFAKLGEEDLNYLFGKMGASGLDGEQGKVTFNIDDEMGAKHKALGIYFNYMEKLMQVSEFAEATKKRKKFWAFMTNINRIMRWSVYAGVVAGLTINPAMLGVFIWTPDMLIGMFVWDWLFARFLNRARDGWGGRNGIAEELVQKLEGMRNTFEQARNAQALSTDNLNMLDNYVKNIEKMWEDTMEKFSKLVKYSPNSTQEVSSGFVNFADTFVKTNMSL
ncbi:MAG: hypothetical protein TR69_WS6001000501 [candidate division WS6 bacterium OLB20]|uniref:Uncharacterized protein n=1 Tax=candidate division WS6 bacterium OLB20 TaxID=1617426 RepID=A0A136LY26_9BACT|nr:MAG: hypothetical protein TR69_WS6001000501 [candidate division WS6 bacterium OLB20]